jgi:hypothetical protein
MLNAMEEVRKSVLLKNGINERRDSRCLCEDDQNAQQQEDDENRCQPETLAYFQKKPEFFDGRGLGHFLLLF